MTVRHDLLRGAARGWLVILVALCGCGGGGTSNAGGGGALTISAQDRSAVLKSIDDKEAALQGQPNDAVDQQLFDHMKTIPQLTNVKLRDGVISANFTDGPFIAIFDNLRYDPANSRAVPLPHATRAATGEPYAKPAQVFSGLGDWLNSPGHGGPDASPDVANYLRTGNSYAVTESQASVDALKNVSGDGVFYIHTHGGAIDLPPHSDPVITDGEQTSFALWTTTARNEDWENPSAPAYDRSIDDDLFFGRLGYAKEVQNGIGGVIPTFEWHYCITPQFIEHYGWKFAQDSLVYINACGSASAAAGQLGFAIKQAGASVYAGWSDEVDNGIANNTARFLIDRLVGANQYKPPTDKLRPYIRSDVEPAMKAAGLGHSDVVVDGAHHVADLLLASLNVPDSAEGGFGVLAPTIQNLEVDEPDHLLTLTGTFGDRPKDHSEKVTLGGIDLTIQSWAIDKIVCILPGDPGYVGDTVVYAYGHESNHVPLTEIHGELQVEQDVDVTQIIDCNGNHPQHTVATSFLDLDIYIRADVHWWRQHLTDAPKQSQPFPIWAAPYSKAHFTHAGAVTSVCGNGTISGSGDLPLAYLANDHFLTSGPKYYFEGTLDPATGTITGKFWFYKADGTVTTPNGTGPYVFLGLPPVVSTPTNPPDYLTTMFFSLDDQFTWLAGQGGSITIPNTSGSGQTIQKLTWTASPATAGTLPQGHDEDTRAAARGKG